MTQSHASLPLGSVANTITNQNHQKMEPIDYTADESMIAVSCMRILKRFSIF